MKALEDMTLEELWHLFPIALQPYQKVWPTWYEQEKSLITQCLPMEHVVRIAHIGSTSFGSIQAKAIIDILVEIAPWEKRMEIAAILKKLGYLCQKMPHVFHLIRDIRQKVLRKKCFICTYVSAMIMMNCTSVII